MLRIAHCCFAAILSMLAWLPLAASASPPIPPAEIGVVVMHGKGGNPGKYVDELARTLEQEGFRVANLEMPWSGARQYDVGITAAENEVTSAINALRAKSAKKVFVAGHSQGGLFALHFGGLQTVDGLIPIAPGGSVDAASFRKALGEPVERARSMVNEGRGNEKAAFADYEASRGTNTVTTTAAIYLAWFDPNGKHTMTSATKNVKAGTPVLYVAPSRDYPALAKIKQESFNALPSHPLTRLYEPEASHLEAPTASIREIINWIGEVASKP